MTQADNALIIFIKNPALGKVKTRIAKTAGDEKALDIYFQLLEITRRNAIILSENKAKNNIQAYVFYSDYINLYDEWSNNIFEKRLQTGEDLGTRMYCAFSEILPHHTKVCIIGSDCPTLSVNILNMAFEHLDNHDFVVGPSTDGGYYLLGIKSSQSPPPQYVFNNIEWSTESVLTKTLNRIEKYHKTVYQLPVLTDIDEEKDWLAFTKLLE